MSNDSCKQSGSGILPPVQGSNPSTKEKLLNRFQVLRSPDTDDSGILRCHDLHTGQKAVLIELAAGDSEKTHGNQPLPEASDLPLGVSFVLPRAIIEADGRFFAVAYPPTFISLADNIALVQNTNHPVTDSEAIRIGCSLCLGSAAISKAGLRTFLVPGWIFLDTSGSVQILALRRDQQPAKKTPNARLSPPTPTSLALLLASLLSPRFNSQQEPLCPPENIENPSLRNALTQAFDGKVTSLDEFQHLLAGANTTPSRHPDAKVNSLVALALVALLILGLLTQGKQDAQEQNQTKQAADDARQAAYATATQWRSFLLDYTDIPPPQVLEAEQLFAKADEFWAASEFPRSKPLYYRANLLYEAGLAVAREILGRRIIAQEARLRGMTVGTDWRRLSASQYVEVPEAIKQAQSALVEGDFRFLDRNYPDARLAYELAAERFESVPVAQLKALTQRHEARVNADRAKYAEQAWKQIAPTGGAGLSEVTKRASSRMAEGQALLAAGDDDKAATAFQEAHEVYRAATAALIKSMVSRQEISDAQDRAVDAAQRWRSLSKLLNTPDSPDITQAEALVQTATEAAKSGKHEQAKTQLKAAAETFEREITTLQERAGSQCEADLTRGNQHLNTLQGQQTALETNLVSARKHIEALNLRLLSERAPADQERLIKELQDARTAHAIASRVSALAGAVVFGSTKYEHARDSLDQAKTLVLQGNKVAAGALSGPAVADLEILTKLPSQMENYLTQEAAVESVAGNARRKIGPIAREQPLTKKLIADADESFAQAKIQIKSGNSEKAQQMLTDARLACDALPAQAEQDLITYATSADSEFRTETAIAALHEVLELNPASDQAKRLLDQVQAKDRPRDRITLVDGAWRLNGKALSKQPSKEDFERVLGKSRTLAGNAGFVFDDFGIMIIPDPENGKIMLTTIYYGAPRYEHEPRKAYPGLVEVGGIAIKHDHPMSDLVASLLRLSPQVTQKQKSIQVTFKGFRIHVAYGQSTSEIYTVSIGLN